MGLLFLGLLSLFSACAAFPYPISTSPSAEPAVRTYFNGAYGFRIDVPENWITVGVNETNLTETPAESKDADSLETVPFEEGGTLIQFIELWNRSNSADKEHAALYVYAELYALSESVYLSQMKQSYAGTFGDVTATLAEEGTAVLDGLSFHHIVFDSVLSTGEDHYYEEYYIRQVEEGQFLILCTTYWADNDLSYKDATKMLACVTFE